MASMTKFPAYNLAHRVPCRRCSTSLVMPDGSPPIRISDLDRTHCPRCRRRALSLAAVSGVLAAILSISIGMHAWP